MNSGPDRWANRPSLTRDKIWTDIHVCPIDDVIEHVETRGCWCQPFVKLAPCECHAMVIHRSADGRELVENPETDYPPATRH